MAPRTKRESTIFAFQLPREISQQVDQLASASFSSRSETIRRLLLVGLTAEKKSRPDDQVQR